MEFKDNKDLKNKSKKVLIKKGDSMKIMKKMPLECVDLFLTDPPYKDYQSNRPTKSKKTKKIIANGFNFEEFVNEMERLLKPFCHFYIFCDHLTFSRFYQAIKDNKKLIYKNMLIWVKNNHGSGDLKGNYAPQHELVIFGTKGKGKKLNGKRISNVLFKKENNCVTFYKKVSNKKYQHSTIKPISILMPFIEKSSKTNDLVFDPYAGSFSTAESSIRLGRRSLSIEIDSGHVRRGKSRIKQVIREISNKN